MSYNVVFAPEAESDYETIGDPVLQSHVLDELDKLSADPQGLGRPGSFPHYLHWKYQFWCTTAEHRIHVTVLFDYTGTDTITIIAIGVIRT